MAITINKASVRRALEQWFIAARAGETLGARETAELSSHEAAAQSSDFFYQLLCDDEDSVPHATADGALEFDFSQAEQLLGQYGGDTDAKFTVGRSAEGKLTAWHSDYPEEGSVVLESFEEQDAAEHPPETGGTMGLSDGHAHDEPAEAAGDEFFE